MGADKCIGCDGTDFGVLQMTPTWVEPYTEEQDAERKIHQRKPGL